MPLSFLNKNLLQHFNTFVLSHWLFLTLSFTYYFVVNGIVENESIKQNLVKSSHSLITTHSDRRKGNVFLSTPDYFLRLTEAVPEVDAVLKSSAISLNFSYQVEGKLQTVRREFPVYLISSGYFEAMEGRFIQGRGFTKNEVFTGTPMAIMGEGALMKIFGKSNSAPSRVWINGIDFQVIGTWSYNASDIIENEAIFLPIGLSQIFGKQSSTFVSNYLLRGQNSESLLKLKKAIDMIQLHSGAIPHRPEFSLSLPSVSRKYDYVMVHNKAYIDTALWISFFVFVILSFFKTKEWISFSKEWAIWNFMLKGNVSDHAKLAYDHWLGLLSLSLVGTVLTSLIIFLFLKFFVKIDLEAGPVYHLSIVMYFLFIPVQYLMTIHWSKRLQYTFLKS